MERSNAPGRDGLVLSDRLGIAPDPVFVPDGLLPVVVRLDGSKTVEEISAELAENTGQPLPRDFVAGVVEDLDQRLALDSPRFQAALQRQVDHFLSAPTRPTRHAGSAGYPVQPTALREALASMVGAPADPVLEGSRPRGLVAPHIDLARGREGYSIAYRALAEAPPADLYVIFGTGHSGPSAPVTGLPLDWTTPLGRVPTDREHIGRVHRALGAPSPMDQFLHRDEHSLEFQVLFLQHILGDRPFQVAAYLCGSLPTESGDPDQESYVEGILEAFRAAEAETEGSVCYIAGADLAHVGPLFGDQQPVDGARLVQLETAMREHLAHLEAGEPGRFHSSVTTGGNPDRVCSAPAMYLTASLAGGPGELLHYGQAPAPDGSQVVGFCGMRFPGERSPQDQSEPAPARR